MSLRFEGLIRRAFEKSGKKVVVLVDEYDKPLLSSLEKGLEHDEIRDTLKAFYSVLKGADHYLRFVFLTGITKFSKASLFSDLNQLRDISMLPAYGENPVPMLYQSGYLTIKSYDQRTMRYTLVFPNDEVKYGFLENLLAAYAPVVKRGNGFFVEDFLDDLAKSDIDSVMRRFQAFFANIPYGITDNFETEQHYQTVFYIVFTLLGQYTGAELRSAAGRAGAVVKTDDTIYVFEFKLNTGEGKTWTAEDALKHDRDYLIPYQSGGRGVVKVGAVFDREKRNLSAWASEAVR